MKIGPKSGLALALAAAVGGSFLTPRLDAYFLNILIDVGVNIILAVSLNLINGYAGQFSLGHAGFMAVGAYTAAGLSTLVSANLLARFHGFEHSCWAFGCFLLALLAGGLLAALTGFLVGAPSLRLKGDYLAIVTLGFGEIIRVLLQNFESLGGARGLSGIPPWATFGWVYGWVAIVIFTVLALVHSTSGRGFLAVRDDEIAAQAVGINTTQYKVSAFVIGAFFAGIAGGLYAHSKQFISPEGFGFMKSVEIVVMVILGGMGNTAGVILAAVVLTLLPEVLRPVAAYRMILYSLLLIVMMLTCPRGLFTALGERAKGWLARPKNGGPP
jgi:branched-chain amino acid transport system permease protein